MFNRSFLWKFLLLLRAEEFRNAGRNSGRPTCKFESSGFWPVPRGSARRLQIARKLWPGQFMLPCEVHLDGSTPRLFIYNEWKEKFWNILSQDVRPACPNPAAWGDRAAYRISDDTAPQWCAWGRGESAAGVLQFPGEFPRKPPAGVWERGRGRGRNARILASGAVSEAAVILPTAPASDTRGNPD